MAEQELTYDELTLERLRALASVVVSREMLEDMPAVMVEPMLDDQLSHLVLTLRAEILAERLAEREVTVRDEQVVRFLFPASPWQHLKRDLYYRGGRALLPRWFLRRWPVRNEAHEQVVTFSKTVRIEQFAMFPASTIRIPERLRGPIVARYERAMVRD